MSWFFLFSVVIIIIVSIVFSFFINNLRFFIIGYIWIFFIYILVFWMFFFVRFFFIFTVFIMMRSVLVFREIWNRFFRISDFIFIRMLMRRMMMSMMMLLFNLLAWYLIWLCRNSLRINRNSVLNLFSFFYFLCLRFLWFNFILWSRSTLAFK